MEAVELGRRLRIAREARGLSQQAAAGALGLPRTAITQMEAGNRSVSTLELTKLSDLYLRPIAYFFDDRAEGEEEDVLVALHRIAPGLEREAAVREQVDHCVSLCREGVVLERLLGDEERSGPPAYEMHLPRNAGDAIQQGERVAEEERRRLSIGSAPIADVSELIATQGIWASGIELPNEMSGLFLRHPSIGLAILVNAHHPRGRKRFSYAHEYAHALMDRDHKITISTADNSAELVEKRANAFAAAFLMPRNGIYEVLRSLDKGLPSRSEQTIFDVASGGHIDAESRPAARSQRITYKDVALVAHHFGVSYQAALYRMKSLKHVSQPESQELLENERFGREYLRVLCMFDDVEEQEQRQYWDRELRSEIAHLAIEAYRREEISRGRLVELSKTLRIDGETLLNLAEVARGE
ncbi:helix-turn-helix domain-containing protein [Amorphus sp. 3PC139-8]|uniref:helix-turn-helix domain-containing protein n=1 Tax=Amorphus sp. 3PC139-8 TaxID=2735676 RepID=UPI00345CC326